MFVFKKLCRILNKQNTAINNNRNSDNVTITQPHTMSITVNQPENKVVMDHSIEIDDKYIDEPHKLFAPDHIEDKPALCPIPSVYVDKKILEVFLDIAAPIEITSRDFFYVINGDIFSENHIYIKTDDFKEFEVKDHFSDQNYEVTEEIEFEEGTLKDDLTQKEFYDDNTDYAITMQNTHYGLIINSKVLLTEDGWNTIVYGDEATCTACNRSLNITEIADHIATNNHKCVLDRFRPLAKFEINIVREINDRYHCAICNITFDNIDHLECVAHGENLLTAINKVLDITQTDDNDFDGGPNGNSNQDNDCMNLNAVVEDSSGFDSESFDGFYDDVSVNYCNDSEQTNNTVSYADIAKKPKTFTTSEYVQVKLNDRDAKVTFDCWNMIITLKSNKFYCMACKEDGPIRHKSEHCLKVNHIENLMQCNIVSDYREHVIRKVDDKLYHCGHCNNLHMIHEIKHHIETKHMKKNIVPNINISEIAPLTKCTGIQGASHSPKVTNKNIKNTHNTDVNNALINSNDSNNYNKIAENVNNENYNIAIPKAVPLNKHSPSTPNFAKKTTQKNTADSMIVDHRNINNEKYNTSQIFNAPSNQVSNVQGNQIVLPKESDQIVIKEFGYTYNISFLAYHFIHQRRPESYFCWICNVWCVNGVRNHTMDPVHGTRMGQIPFMRQTSFHLIRQINYGFHCLVCNMLIQYNPVLHTWDHMHLALLNRAIYVSPLPSTSNSSAETPAVLQSNPTINSNQNIIESPEIETVKDKGEKTKDSENIDKGKNKANSETEVTETVEANDFDTEECVYVKVKNIYTKITRTSYNSLVQIGNGARYCMLCSIEVVFQDLKAHISSPGHALKLGKCKFLEKYERHLLRQMSTCYHCALCNVCILKNFLNDHISWATHKETEANKIAKHIRRNEIKTGITEIACSTQKEIVNNNMNDEFEILANIEFHLHAQQSVVKRNKIVMIDDGVVLKLSWDAFHGICKNKNGYKCLICQTDFKHYELSTHIESSRHMQVLENCFQLEFTPALFRKVNNSILHCLTCNMEVKNEQHAITDHITSKRHIKIHSRTVADKSDSDVGETDILILKRNDCDKKV